MVFTQKKISHCEDDSLLHKTRASINRPDPMTDFFSRIFSIPSDVSSNYSDDGGLVVGVGAGNGVNRNNAVSGGGGGGKNGKKRRERKREEREEGGGRKSRSSLPPRCAFDGNDTITSSNGNTPASDSILGWSTRGSDSETMEEHPHQYPYDDEDYGGESDRRALRLGGESRGRQRRIDAPPRPHRSSSEKPRVGGGKGGGVAVDAGKNSPRAPNRLQLDISPTRRHRSLSKVRDNNGPSSGGRVHAEASSSRDWSSREDDHDEKEEEKKEGGARAGRHRRSSSLVVHKLSSSSSNRENHRHQPSGSKTATDYGTTRQHDKANWLSRKLAGVGSKMNSTASGGGGGAAPQLQPQGGERTGKSRRSTTENAVEEARATASSGRRQKPRATSRGNVGDRDDKLNLPTMGGRIQRKQPINVGDSIVISQELLEESMEMSVLTMPRELMNTMSGGVSASEEEREGGEWLDKGATMGAVTSKYEYFAADIQEVGQRTVMENDIIKAYYSNRQAGQDEDEVVSTGINSVDGPAYPKIGAHASRFLGDECNNHSIYQSYSRDQSIVHDREDGIEVSPANRLGLVNPHAGLSVRHREDEGATGPKTPTSPGSGKHRWPCDPSAEGYSLKLDGRGIPLSPPPPPPPPATLSRRVLPLEVIPHQSSQQQVTAFCNTPVSENFETVAARYNNPQGSLAEPTAHLPDPPGDEFRPFDEFSSGFDIGGLLLDQQVAPTSMAPQPTDQGNLRSPGCKAVTFSLPPPKITSRHSTLLPAPPSTGSALDNNFSMNRNPKTNTKFWSSSLSPPITELWSSVECPNNIFSGFGVSALRWNSKKESELLGEKIPLHVLEECIEFCDKEEGKVEATSHAILIESADVLSCWQVCGTGRHRFLSNQDLPEDEYMNDILDCEDEGFASKTAFRSNDDRKDSCLSNHMDSDADLRHRSTWTYKPPKLSFSGDDPVRVKEDNWNVRAQKRVNAIIAIQRFVRGTLERQRHRLLLGNVLIIQLCMRRYISRRRYQDSLKLKRSYHPSRWKSVRMAVPKSNILT